MIASNEGSRNKRRDVLSLEGKELSIENKRKGVRIYC